MQGRRYKRPLLFEETKMKKFVLEFRHQPSRYYSKEVIESVFFDATSFLDLYQQIEWWRGDGDYAPVYMDEICGIYEVQADGFYKKVPTDSFYKEEQL